MKIKQLFAATLAGAMALTAMPTSALYVSATELAVVDPTEDALEDTMQASDNERSQRNDDASANDSTKVALADGCDSMGTVSYDADTGAYTAVPTPIPNLITQADPTLSDYIFAGWFASPEADGEALSMDSSYTPDNAPEGQTLYAKFDPNPFYKQADYWMAELSKNSLWTQEESDIWYYQKFNTTSSSWENMTQHDANPTDVGEAPGLWGNHESDKISISQLTPTNFKVAYAWKAPKPGYYSVKLTSPIIGVPPANRGQAGITVQYASSLSESGSNLWSRNGITVGTTIQDCRIAKMSKNECIRIGNYESGRPKWITGVYPEIVPRTAREYAGQYTDDIANLLKSSPYTTSSAAAIGSAKDALDAALADNSTTEDRFTELIEALEATVENAHYQITSVSITDALTTLEPGQARQLRVSAGLNTTPASTEANYAPDSNELTWTSSNPEAISVEGGYIRALGEGSATITVSSTDASAITDSVTITVEKSAYTVSVGDNASIEGTEEKSKEFKTRETAKVSTTVPAENQKFQHWENDAGVVMCYAPNYSFPVISDITLTPVYSEEELEKQSVISCSAAYNPTKDRVVFSASRTIPIEKCPSGKVTAHGVIVTTDATLGSDLNAFKVDASGIKKATAKTAFGLLGTYTVNVSCQSGETCYGRTWMTYETVDADGIKKEVTEYSDIASAAKP